MLTSYMVKCPKPQCGWFGSLLPRRDLEAWRFAVPTSSVVVFQCPNCQGEWRARMVGDDVLPLAREESAVPAV